MGQKSSNPDHYTYRVIWSEEDGEYVGLCAEYPSLSYLAPAGGEVLEGISALVRDVAADLAASGESAR
ncbi:MAG: hypothetical protein KKG92_13295 [Gammaproteobacteria bacterium]|nr:hypothetical protein [Gammaproteobacteria bacterium]